MEGVMGIRKYGDTYLDWGSKPLDSGMGLEL